MRVRAGAAPNPPHQSIVPRAGQFHQPGVGFVIRFQALVELLGRHEHRIERLGAHDRTTFATALDGLYRRSSVDEAEGALSNAMPTVIKWDTWVAFWSLTIGDVEEPATP